MTTEKSALVMLDQIESRCSHLRDVCNWAVVFKDWLRYCAGMDAIDDANLAIRYFVGDFVPTTDSPEFSGELYLAVYGLLQAMYVQTEGVRAIFGAADWTPPKCDHLCARHRYAAHPAPGYEAGFMTRLSMSKWGFNGRLYSQKTGCYGFEEVLLKPLLERHCSWTFEQLDSFLEYARADFQGHYDRALEYPIAPIADALSRNPFVGEADVPFERCRDACVAALSNLAEIRFMANQRAVDAKSDPFSLGIGSRGKLSGLPFKFTGMPSSTLPPVPRSETH